MYLAKIHVTLKKSVLDPQGVAVSNALQHMGYQDVNSVRLGKYLEVKIEDKGQKKEKLNQEVDEMCKKLLANLVIESYEFQIEKV